MAELPSEESLVHLAIGLQDKIALLSFSVPRNAHELVQKSSLRVHIFYTMVVQICKLAVGNKGFLVSSCHKKLWQTHLRVYKPFKLCCYACPSYCSAVPVDHMEP